GLLGSPFSGPLVIFSLSADSESVGTSAAAQSRMARGHQRPSRLMASPLRIAALAGSARRVWLPLFYHLPPRPHTLFPWGPFSLPPRPPGALALPRFSR